MGMKASNKIATFFKYFVLILVGVIMIYPLLWMISATFKDNSEIFAGISLWIKHPTLDGYRGALNNFGYRHIGGTLGNIDLDLGDQNDFDFSIDNMDLSSDNFSFGVFHRSYVGLDRKGRFGLFAELELSVTTGSSDFKYKSGDTYKTTYSDNFQARLSFNPGMAVYIFPNVCGTLSFGLGGIQYSSVTQKDENGVKTGSRDASKMRFRLNLANINIGMTVHLWDKKKK